MSVHSVANVTITALVTTAAITASAPIAVATATTVTRTATTTAQRASPTAVVPSRVTHGTLMQRTPSVPATIVRVAKATTHVPASTARAAMASVPQVAASVSVLPVVASRRVASTTSIARRSRFSIVRR